MAKVSKLTKTLAATVTSIAGGVMTALGVSALFAGSSPVVLIVLGVSVVTTGVVIAKVL